jgi:hypothetical protein
MNLAQNLEDLLYNVTDTAFFYNDLEDCDTVVRLFWGRRPFVPLLLLGLHLFRFLSTTFLKLFLQQNFKTFITSFPGSS